MRPETWYTHNAPQPRSWRQLRPWRRHSLVLVLAGIVYMCIGVVYVAVPLTDDRTSGLRAALSYHIPIDFWGALWILVGLAAILSARWPPQSERWGYTALSGMAGLWAAFYTLGTLQGAGMLNLTGTLVWGLMVAVWWGIAGLVNPEDLPPAPERPGAA